MKQWFIQHRRAGIFVGLTLLVPVYLFFSVLGAALFQRAAYQSAIETIEPRIARMRGLVANEAVMRAALEAVGGETIDLIYPASSDAQAVAAALQAEARRVLSDAGMQITNSQVLPDRKREAFDYIGVKVVATGGLEQLDQALATLAAFRPNIYIEAMDIFPNRRSKRADGSEQQLLTVSLQLLSVRSAQ